MYRIKTGADIYEEYTVYTYRYRHTGKDIHVQCTHMYRIYIYSTHTYRYRYKSIVHIQVQIYMYSVHCTLNYMRVHTKYKLIYIPKLRFDGQEIQLVYTFCWYIPAPQKLPG